MKSLNNLLLKRKKETKTSFSDKDVFYIFEKIIKEEFGRLGLTQFKAEYFKDKKLFVKCPNSIWRSELMLNKPRIIRKINAELGEESINEIRLK